MRKNVGSNAEPDWTQFKKEIERQLSNYSGDVDPLISFIDREIESHDSSNSVAIWKMIENSENKRQKTIGHMMAFLWTYESVYMYCVDTFCFLLIANGHDLFDLISRKYVKTLDELGFVDISTKLSFLQEHNFAIFQRKEDRKLRNKIAHHDFLITDSGNVSIKDGHKFVEIDIEQKHRDLLIFSFKALDIFLTSVFPEYGHIKVKVTILDKGTDTKGTA